MLQTTWKVKLMLLLALLCPKYGGGQQNCIDELDARDDLFCTDIENFGDSSQLSINCTAESTYLISHNILYERDDIEFIRLGVACGADCAYTMILSDVNYKEPYDPETLSGQLNITNATDCVVTGCYQVYTSRAGLTTIHFLPQSCVLGPSTTDSTLGETTTEPETSTSATTDGTPVGETTIAMETTTDDTDNTLLTITLSIIGSLIILLSVIGVIIIVLRRIRMYKYHSQLYYLKSMGIPENEFDDYFDMDPVRIGLSKTMSASEPSLLFALDKFPISVHMTTTSASELTKINLSSDPTPWSLQSRLEERSGDGTLDLHSKDLASLNSYSESSLSLDDHEHQASSILLDQPIKHEEKGYCKIELITNSKISKALDFKERTSSSVVPHESEIMDEHSSEYEGYIGKTSDSSKKDTNTSTGYTTNSECQITNSNDYVEFRNSKSENQPTDLDLQIITNDSSQNVASGTVIFDFTPSNNTMVDSANQEATGTDVAFDFSTSPSHMPTDDPTDDHIVTLLEEAAAHATIEVDQQNSDYIDVPRGMPRFSLPDSLVLDEEKLIDTDYMISLDSGISFNLSHNDQMKNVSTFSNTDHDYSQHESHDTYPSTNASSTDYVSSEALYSTMFKS